MPFAIKLSKQFYDTLGNEVANELVTVLNTLDQAYRTEFRDLFTAHAGRLEDRMGQLETRMDEKLSQLETRFDEKLSQLEIRMNARMDAKLEALKSELLRWMFLFWVGTMGTVVALLKL
jgi:ABC-type phosphate transport system auxiliary subunit